MSEFTSALQERFATAIRAGDLPQCERVITDSLAALPMSPFHVALDLVITNEPAAVAAHCDDFFRREKARYRVGAAYAELNGFEINPERWYFDLFAFGSYGGSADHDWLSEPQSQDYKELTIRGLEPLQAVYASVDGADRALKDAWQVAGLLVVVKFQDLLRRAAPLMEELRFPLLATAHEYYDVYYEIPGPRK